jgi:hypothetical protein
MTIEECLAELRRNLHVGPLAKRRILREVEEHLLERSKRNPARIRASFSR